MKTRETCFIVHTSFLVAAAFLGAIAAPAAAQDLSDAFPPEIMVEDTELGRILTTTQGYTLYRFDPDERGQSNCNGNCSISWPPLIAGMFSDRAGKFSVVVRNDGTLQWALGGLPLYLYAEDAVPGEIRGDGVNGAWHVVHASAVADAAPWTKTVSPPPPSATDY